jgi:hypothetical protein
MVASGPADGAERAAPGCSLRFNDGDDDTRRNTSTVASRWVPPRGVEWQIPSKSFGVR